MSRPLTVVVPAHGHDELLLKLLRELDAEARAGESLSVVVADDASPEPLDPLLAREAFPALELEVVRRTTSGGPGAARNAALDRVSTPWVAFLDSDEVPAAGWLSRLEQLVARPDAPGVIEGRIDAGQGSITPFTHVTEASATAEQHVAGNVAFRTDVLRSVGGFSEEYFDAERKLHFREDIELYFRMRAAGHGIAYHDDLVAFHPPLRPSFAVPLREARRYYFDALLSKQHPHAFREAMRKRRVGPFPLRRARHQAAQLFALTTAATAVGLLARRPWLVGAGAFGLAVAWSLNVAALSWRREVRPGIVPKVIAAAAIAPWVYLWHYYRGVLRFRHLPRL